MNFFIVLWSATFCLLGLGILHMTSLRSFDRGKIIQPSPRITGLVPLMAIFCSLFAMGVWDSLVWNISLGFLVFGALGFITPVIPSNLLEFLLVAASIVCVPSHASGVFLPIVQWVELPVFVSFVIDVLVLWTTIRCLRASRKPEGIFCGTFLGVWAALFLFFSHTAFGSVIGWDYLVLTQICQAFLGTFCVLLVLNSSPAIIQIGSSGAWGLAAGFAIYICQIGCPWLIFGLLPVPLMRWAMAGKELSALHKRGYSDSILAPSFCLLNTVIMCGVLKGIHLSPIL